MSSQKQSKRYKQAFSWAGRAGRCQIRDTIVLAGSPGSGTTLLLEVVHKLDGYKAVNEPLQVRSAEAHGFTHRTFLAPSGRAARQRAYRERVCTGQLGRPPASVKEKLRKHPADQLAKWKQHLSARQIDAVLGIVDAVGLPRFYTEAEGPCYDELNRLQQAAWRWPVAPSLVTSEPY